MKKMIFTATLFAFAFAFSSIASASDFDSSKASIGASYSLDGYVGFNAGYDLASNIKQPISVQAFYKSKSESIAGVSATHSGVGALALYDLSKQFPLGDGIKAYVGAGLIKEDYSVAAGNLALSASRSGLQVAVGVTYQLDPNVLLDVNYSFGGANVGANYKF